MRHSFFKFIVFALMAMLWPVLAQAYEGEALTAKALLEPGQMIFGLISGILLTAGIYLFFIWLAIRDRSQIALIVILGALAANLGLSTGVIVQSLGLSDETTILFLRETAMLVFLGGACLFTLSFLEIANFNYTLSLLYKFLLVVLAGVFGLLAFNAYFVANFMSIVSLVIFSLCLLGGLIAMFKRVPGAGIHILAFGILMLGSLAFPMTTVGIIGGRIFGIDTFYFTSALAALVFAVGIAGQFSRRQEEKERQLAISNDRFSLATQGSNEGLFDWNLEEKTAFFTDRMKKIMGRDLDASPDGVRQWLDTIVPEQRKQIQQMLNDFMKGEAVTIGFEYKIRRPDGTERWLYSNGVVMRDGAGKVKRFVGSTGDISERKKAEVALKESETRFRNITEAHPVPVAIIAISDSKFLYASPGVEELLGVPLSDLIGYQATPYFVQTEDLQKLMSAVVYEEEVNGRESVMRRVGGIDVPVSISARLIQYQEYSAIVLGFADLSERKKAEEEIASQRKALEQSEKLAALGSLLAGVAHELNNPLSVVVGQASLLLETNTDPKTQNRAEKIKKAAERCTRIVRNFLALARRKDPERRNVDMNAMINNALELLAPQLKNDAVELKLELADGLPQVSADTDQLTQILTNLVLNAKQALVDRPAPRVVTISTSTDETRQYILLRVADNGTGVPAHIKARIFEPFFTTKKEGSGTGIGLSLSLGLAEAHGGTLTCEDAPAGGAQFTLTLPVSVQGAEPVLVDVVAAASPVTGKKILLVDDEPDVMQILADLLVKDQHVTVQANNGEEALHALDTQGPFDVIISDLRMPVMDGPTFYRTLREKMPRYQDRIMFVTGDTLSTHVRSFLEEFPVIVVDKPYVLDDVRHAMIRLLRIAEKNAARKTQTEKVTHA